MKKVIKATLASLAFLATVACSGESETISMVKKGSLNKCSYYTVEELVNSFLEKPKWEHIVDKNGIDYVNISGFTANGKPANVVMQFWIRKNEFGLQALEIDKEVQNNIFGISILIDRMCESARKAAKEKAEAKKTEEFNKVRVIPAEPLKDPNNSKKEENLLKDSRDGKNYKTVKIGTQTWMAENLNYNADGSKCYNNSENNCQKYGRLYNWATAVNACPNGWQLPSNAEWDALYRFADGTSGTSNPYESETAGKYLKATSGWNSGGNGTDAYGFTALPGGLGNPDGSFKGADDFGYWWDASEHNAKNAYRRSILHSDERAYWRHGNKSNLLSVRCIKEEKTEDEAKAMEELEQEAKKWQGAEVSYKSVEGKYFTFKGTAKRYVETGAGDLSWTATSKMKISNCPAKSVWKMTSWYEEGKGSGENEIPAKCKSITPKIITNHRFNEFE